MSKAPVTFTAKKSNHALARTSAFRFGTTSPLVQAPRFLALASLLFLASPALAQTNEVSVQRFDPAVGAGNFLTTRTAAVHGHLNWTAGLMANYAFEPFVVKNCTDKSCDTSTTIPVVENMVTGDLMGSINLIDRIQVGLKVPVSWVKGLGLPDPADGSTPTDGLSAVGLGDIQLEAKGRFYGEADDLFVIGGYIYGTAPMGSITAEDSYIGNTSPTVGGAVIADGDMGPLSYGVNVGGMYRTEAQVGASNLGPEMRWSAAVGYEVSPIISVVADAFGGANFGSEPGGNTIELDAGGKFRPLGNQITITVGGGVGLLKGVGLPTARGFLGVLYNAETQDRDRDGISDDQDACADAAEDMDGFEDSDGCPEFDNDQDGLPDEVDKCPNKPEDIDDFEDKDGCPEADNDKDGILDTADHCPNEPETVNGVDDLDGCPDVKDTDSDGIPDEKDKCINEPEDTDGFEDTDGCPDPDNDKDGIPDNSDECIDEPEDGKGDDNEKNDGCPIDA